MYRFVNFKGFADATLDLDRAPVTILIGRNGAGKSNAIEALSLLSDLASGTALTDIGDIAESGKHKVRGGLAGCFRQGFRMLRLCYRDASVRYSLTLGAATSEGREIVTKEWLELGVGSDRMFEIVGQDRTRGVFEVRLNNFKRGPNKPVLTASASRSVLSQYSMLAAPVVAASKLAEVQNDVQCTVEAIGRVRVFDPHPTVMRGYVRQSDDLLESDASNLAAVLWRLHQDTASGQESLQRILEGIARLPEEKFVDWVFDATKFGSVAFALKLENGTQVETTLLSDGTLRALAIMAAAETAEVGDIVVIEELDNGVHPSRTAMLLDYCWQAAKRRGVQILVTTHNESTLNALSSEQLDGVMVCHWDATSAGSKITPLQELPDYLAVVAAGKLGAAAAAGIIERSARTKTKDEADLEMRQALEWVEALRNREDR